MSSRGRPAALPPLGWQPPARHQGTRIEFVSEDGRQRRFYDCSPLPGREQVKDELAAAFAAATGPLGTQSQCVAIKFDDCHTGLCSH